MSTGGVSAQLISLRLPRLGTSGNRVASSWLAFLSISECQMVSAPKWFSTAKSNPPYPVQNDPTVSILLLVLFGRRCVRADGLPKRALRRWLRIRIRRGVPGSGLNGGSSSPALPVGRHEPPSEHGDTD
jgi:hypothetical protein